MDAQSYDAWYETPRGRWIGERETALLIEQLQPRAGESLLDVGCGTGYFTRHLAAAMDGAVTGVDINSEWIGFARSRGGSRTTFAVADARSLPYATASFDLAISIVALCFIEDERAAIREILRVCRRRFALGLLNRHSLLWLQKGRGGGSGGYLGAQWHTISNARRLFAGLPVENLHFRTAIQMPAGGLFARFVEYRWPASWPTGAFLLAVGDVADTASS